MHLLNEEDRGAALEAGAVSRIRMVSRFPIMAGLPIASVRFVAVSATIPNVADIAAWLRVPPEGFKARTCLLGASAPLPPSPLCRLLFLCTSRAQPHTTDAIK